MTDLEQFLALVKKAGQCYEMRTTDLLDARATKLVEVAKGYGCHFEAEFDDDGNIVSIGHWDEM